MGTPDKVTKRKRLVLIFSVPLDKKDFNTGAPCSSWGKAALLPIPAVGQQHLPYVVERFAGGILDLVNGLAFAELGEEVGHIGLDLKTTDSNLAVVAFHQVVKKLLQGVRFRNHGSGSFHKIPHRPRYES